VCVCACGPGIRLAHVTYHVRASGGLGFTAVAAEGEAGSSAGGREHPGGVAPGEKVAHVLTLRSVVVVTHARDARDAAVSHLHPDLTRHHRLADALDEGVLGARRGEAVRAAQLAKLLVHHRLDVLRGSLQKRGGRRLSLGGPNVSRLCDGRGPGAEDVAARLLALLGGERGGVGAARGRHRDVAAAEGDLGSAARGLVEPRGGPVGDEVTAVLVRTVGVGVGGVAARGRGRAEHLGLHRGG